MEIPITEQLKQLQKRISELEKAKERRHGQMHDTDTEATIVDQFKAEITRLEEKIARLDRRVDSLTDLALNSATREQLLEGLSRV